MPDSKRYGLNFHCQRAGFRVDVVLIHGVTGDLVDLDSLAGV